MPAPLKEQICYTLYATSLAVTRCYKPMLDALGITYPQYLVLNTLGEADGLSIGGIADRLDLESSTITPPVKRLEQAGLVRRRRGTADERLVQVFLTEAGRAVLLRSSCLNETLLARSGLTQGEIDALNAQLQALRAALGRGGEA